MRLTKWFIGAALSALFVAPMVARADIQYVYVKGSFSEVNGGPQGSQTVNILTPTSTLLYPKAVLNVATSSGGVVSGNVEDSSANLLFNFGKGNVTAFTTKGNTAVFAVNGVKYSSVAAGIQPYIVPGSTGTFTGSTTAWNGSSGKFNGNFASATPELGSSVAMATMLLGAGFLGFRRRR